MMIIKMQMNLDTLKIVNENIKVEKPKKEKVKKVVKNKANKSVKVVALTKS